MWKHSKRLIIRIGGAVLFIGAVLVAIVFILRSIWSRLSIGPGTAQRYIDHLDDPSFYIAIGLAIVIVIIWAILRFIQGLR